MSSDDPLVIFLYMASRQYGVTRDDIDVTIAFATQVGKAVNFDDHEAAAWALEAAKTLREAKR